MIPKMYCSKCNKIFVEPDVASINGLLFGICPYCNSDNISGLEVICGRFFDAFSRVINSKRIKNDS